MPQLWSRQLDTVGKAYHPASSRAQGFSGKELALVGPPPTTRERWVKLVMQPCEAMFFRDSSWGVRLEPAAMTNGINIPICESEDNQSFAIPAIAPFLSFSIIVR